MKYLKVILVNNWFKSTHTVLPKFTIPTTYRYIYNGNKPRYIVLSLKNKRG